MATRGQNRASNRGGGAMDEAMRTVVSLEADVEALRVRYEQHFLGLSRMAPSEEHARLRGQLLRLRGAAPNNAAVRFRLQALHNRFLSYERMWTRTMREREDGTYHRDVAKARRRREALLAESQAREAERAAAAAKGREAAGGKGDVEEERGRRSRLEQEREGRERKRAELSEKKMRSLYDAFVSAKTRCNEPTQNLSYDALASRLRRQIPQILEKHQAKSVEFKVVIKDGKALIKAVPKGR